MTTQHRPDGREQEDGMKVHLAKAAFWFIGAAIWFWLAFDPTPDRVLYIICCVQMTLSGLVYGAEHMAAIEGKGA